MDESTEPQPIGTCAGCGEPIPHGGAFIENADGSTYHPEHYPEPEPEADPDQLDIPTDEPAPKRKASR